MKVSSGETRLEVQVRGETVTLWFSGHGRQWKWMAQRPRIHEDGYQQTYAAAYRSAMRAADAVVPKGRGR